jgi:hypothetical protein
LASASAAACAATAALNWHRIAFDSQIGRGNASAAIDERELERLTVGEVGETRLLDRGDMDEYVFSAIIANDEAKALLRVEEFDDAFAFANDLGRHSAATATAAAEATASTAAAAETAAAAAEAAAVTITAASAAVAAATAAESTTPAAVAAALFESAAGELTAEIITTAETIALVAAAAAAIPLAPSIETHACPNFREPALI